MGMNIQHNMEAMNAHRNMGVANGKTSKAMEKLSTGFRINRAADDAAGLAISEKMRSQIRGLTQAKRNASDGINLVQTADGALGTTGDILQRMQTLATNAATGTLTGEDKKKAEAEVTNLLDEINRIADTTEFNTMKLLNGDMSNGKGGLDVSSSAATVINATKALFDTRNGAYAPIQGTVNLNGDKIKALVATMAGNLSADVTVSVLRPGATNSETVVLSMSTSKYMTDLRKMQTDFAALSTTTSFDTAAFVDLYEKALNDVAATKGLEFDLTVVNGKLEMNTKDGNSKFTVTTPGNALTGLGIAAASVVQSAQAFAEAGITINRDFQMDINGKSYAVSMGQISNISAGESSAKFVSDLLTSVKATISDAMTAQGLTAGKAGYIDATQVSIKADAKTGKLGVFFSETQLDVAFKGGLADQMGLKGGHNSKGNSEYPGSGMTLHIGANENQVMNFGIGDMHTDSLGLKGISISTGLDSEKALTTIQNAISIVNDQRAQLGAVQNRLEYTTTNLDTTAENLQASESGIRDTDMASEVMNQTQSNILQQAAQAMLAQAKQQPQSVLQLLG